jgi:hypothetical protein
VVVRIFSGGELARIIHSWKSYTANVANSVIGKRGPFWYREYYDHCIRDQKELERSIRYVLDNPAKAGLREWPYVGSAGW